MFWASTETENPLRAQQAAETHHSPRLRSSSEQLWAALSTYSNTNNHQRLLGGFFLWGEKHRFSNLCARSAIQTAAETLCAKAKKKKKPVTAMSSSLFFSPLSLQLRQNCRWRKHYLAAKKLCTVCKHRFLQTLTGSHLLTAGKIANYVSSFSTQTRLGETHVCLFGK